MAVRIGILGAGFGRTAMLPALSHVDGSQVVAIWSRNLSRTEAVAKEFNIPRFFDDYRTMIDQVDMDLVAVVSPVHLHHPMTLKGIEAGRHVLCEKPMALDVMQSFEMTEAAAKHGVINVIDFELRFEPNRMRVKQLLADGFIGKPYHVEMHLPGSSRADPARPPWSWWSDAAQGGGGLGAQGPHMFDLLRWWFGEVTTLTGQVATWVKRRLATDSGEMLPVTSDDQWAVIAELAGGVLAVLFESRVMRHPTNPRIVITGSNGTLVIDHEERLWGAQAGEPLREMTTRGPCWGLPGLSRSIYSVSLVELLRELVDAIAHGRKPQGTACFEDGLYCQAIIDAVRLSWHERCWIRPLDLIPRKNQRKDYTLDCTRR